MICPPLLDDDLPALTTTEPPTPLFPEPTLMKMLPPKPLCEDPDPTYTEPLAPTLAVPVLKVRAPLVPDTPAFEVVSVTVPLELSLLNPL